jgi:Predicted integral membrane protein
LNRTWLTGLKLVVSVASLVIVFRAVDFSSLAIDLAKFGFGYVVFALVVFWVAQVVSSLRYAYVARTLGADLPFPASLKAHFVGLWFNQVLPTGLGGDVLKVAVLRNLVGTSVAVRAVLLDRLSGLFLLMFAILITLPLYSAIWPAEQAMLQVGLGAVSIGFLGATVLGAGAADRFKGAVVSIPLAGQFFALVADVWRFRKGRALWGQLWTSLIIHLNGIAVFALLGLSLGLEVDPLVFTLIVPLILLVGLMPISFAGWGVRELGAVWLLGLVGFPPENALLLSVGYGLLLLVAGLPGLFLFNSTAISRQAQPSRN